VQGDNTDDEGSKLLWNGGQYVPDISDENRFHKMPDFDEIMKGQLYKLILIRNHRTSNSPCAGFIQVVDTLLLVSCSCRPDLSAIETV
jgi:hypothetical protein